jgi:hypothetical protein
MSGVRPVWETHEVASRFIEAAQTALRLPPVRVQGYLSLWPTIVRSAYERLSSEDAPTLHIPPSPRDVERMLEVMRWVQWLDVEQRHLVWMRAQHYGWREIGIRFACASRTAQRHWQVAVCVVTWQLNA